MNNIKAKLNGRTIKSINTDSVNMIVVTFIDGYKIKLFAECGSSSLSIPFFTIEEE